MPWLIGSAVIIALGYGADKTGEGIDSASNGVMKLAVTGAVGFYALKKMKVI